VYIQNPPGEHEVHGGDPHAPKELKHEEHQLATEIPKVNVWMAIIFIVRSLSPSYRHE
jgi:hypothetical protein